MAKKTILVCDKCGEDAVERLKIRGSILGTSIVLDVCQFHLDEFSSDNEQHVCSCGRPFETYNGLKIHMARAGHG